MEKKSSGPLGRQGFPRLQKAQTIKKVLLLETLSKKIRRKGAGWAEI